MQIFPPWSNSVARVTLVALLLAVPFAAACAMLIVRSDFYTGRNFAPRQPVQFSHRHHVRTVGLDCRYCHIGAERGTSAGIPDASTCMTCHSQVWADSPMLEPVRVSYREDRPLRWRRVNRLPDHVYFDHSIHIAKGVSCSECHGAVEQMALAFPARTLHMAFCLDCHRDPSARLSQPGAVFANALPFRKPPAGPHEDLTVFYDIATAQLRDCTICHR